MQVVQVSRCRRADSLAGSPVAFLLFLLVFSFFNQNLFAARPAAKDGILDLRVWNFGKDGIVELSGQWKFYPWKYYDPKTLSSQNPGEGEYVSVPANWTGYPAEKNKMPVFGFATYRLKIVLDSKVSQSGRALSLGMPTMFSAYKIWIDTTLTMVI